MHDFIAFLKDVVQRGPNSGANGCYIVRDGSIYARDNNRGIQAGVPMESAVEFHIPADMMDAALARMKAVDSLTVEEDVVTIKGGRLKVTIKLDPSPVPTKPDMPSKWTPSPEGLTAALGLAVPFLGERVWTQGVRLMNKRVTAINNASAIDIDLPKLKVPRPLLLPKEAMTFLIAQGDPDKYHVEDNAILFGYEDGRWLRTQLIAGEFPDTVEGIFEKAGSKYPYIIDEEFREAWADAAALSDNAGVITLSKTGFATRKGDSNTEVAYPNKLPKDHKSKWGVPVFDKVAKVATAWNPTIWPEACPFKGDNFRGVVVGIRGEG